MYVVRNITPQGILISPIGNVSSLSLIVNTPSGWKVEGTTQPYKLEFLPHETMVKSLPDKVWIFVIINRENPSDSYVEGAYTTKEKAARGVVDFWRKILSL